MRQDPLSSEAVPVPDRRSPAFDVRVVEDGEGVVVRVSGEIDVAARDALWDAIEQAAACRPRLVIDVAEMTFIDSTGLSALVRAHRRLGQLREAVVVRAPTAATRRVLTISGIDRLVTIDGVDATAPVEVEVEVGDGSRAPSTSN